MIIKFRNNNEITYLKYYNRIGDQIELVVVLNKEEATSFNEERFKIFKFFFNKAKKKAFTVFHNRVHHPLKIDGNTITTFKGVNINV